MNKLFRPFLAILFLLGIVFMAQSRVAWANQGAGPSPASREGPKLTVRADRNDDCENTNNDRNKKNKCKGTVKPPKRQIVIPVTGDYSVGGFCALRVELSDPAVRLDASVVSPLPRELPDKVQKVRQGCLLTYNSSDQRLLQLLPQSGTATICFAATPQKQMTVYFYDSYAASPVWAPLQTTTENGLTCATASQSGVYVATFENG